MKQTGRVSVLSWKHCNGSVRFPTFPKCTSSKTTWSGCVIPQKRVKKARKVMTPSASL